VLSYTNFSYFSFQLKKSTEPRDVLPEHAQDTFRNAFNNTHEESGNEEQSFKIAWLAVKRAYRTHIPHPLKDF